VPLHPRVTEEFKKASALKDGEGFVFPQHVHPHRRFAQHLEAAGLNRFDAAGRKIDFHALRYTFATKLARQGVSQRLAQELLRHSDPRLTANLYTDAAHLPTFDAIDNLHWHEQESSETCPPIGPPQPDSNGLELLQPVASHHDKIITQTFVDEVDIHDISRPDLTGHMAGAAGFEPTTCGLEDRCSIQLSYAPEY